MLARRIQYLKGRDAVQLYLSVILSTNLVCSVPFYLSILYHVNIVQLRHGIVWHVHQHSLELILLERGTKHFQSKFFDLNQTWYNTPQSDYTLHSYACVNFRIEIHQDFSKKLFSIYYYVSSGAIFIKVFIAIQKKMNLSMF